ncbi:MAG: hypothetical protein JWM34_3026 [Ilumatobacteraceae bacterium]|nr:hypothetical protein [Ilumatobacteraceae bacterium]
MTTSNETVAAFDFDGTLSRRDCVVPFLERMTGRAGLVAGLARHPVTLAAALARRDRDGLKALAIRTAFTGRTADEVAALGRSFADTVHASGLRPDTTARLAWHHAQRHRTVLVSASLGVYLRRIGELLGVDAVLCTETLVGMDGRYNGEMSGDNCRGPEKVRRLEAWMSENDLVGADVWAYGDSAGDRELLASAQHAFLVKGIELDAVPAGRA